MRPHAEHLDHPPDSAVANELASEHRALHVQPLAEVDRVLLAGLGRHGPHLGELGQRSHGRFVGEVVLAVRHHTQAEARSPRGDRRARDELDPVVGQDGVLVGAASTPG